MRDRKAPVLIVMGAIVVLVFGELAMRMAGDTVPGVSEWPTPEAEVKFEQLTSGQLDPNVVVLGSSFVEAAVDPSQMDLGFDTYNLAMPFSTYGSMAWWLENVVSGFAKLEVVVIGVPTSSEAGSSDTWMVGGLTEAHARATGDALDESYLWRSRGALGQLDRSLARQRLLAAELWNRYGHQTAYYHQNVPETSWVTRPPSAMTVQEEASLRALIDVAGGHASMVALLLEPTALPVRDSDALARRLETIHSVGRELGAAVWVPPDRFWADANFVDGIHFDDAAASAFTKFVARQLDDMGTSP